MWEVLFGIVTGGVWTAHHRDHKSYKTLVIRVVCGLLFGHALFSAGYYRHFSDEHLREVVSALPTFLVELAAGPAFGLACFVASLLFITHLAERPRRLCSAYGVLLSTISLISYDLLASLYKVDMYQFLVHVAIVYVLCHFIATVSSSPSGQFIGNNIFGGGLLILLLSKLNNGEEHPLRLLAASYGAAAAVASHEQLQDHSDFALLCNTVWEMLLGVVLFTSTLVAEAEFVVNREYTQEARVLHKLMNEKSNAYLMSIALLLFISGFVLGGFGATPLYILEIVLLLFFFSTLGSDIARCLKYFCLPAFIIFNCSTLLIIALWSTVIFADHIQERVDPKSGEEEKQSSRLRWCKDVLQFLILHIAYMIIGAGVYGIVFCTSLMQMRDTVRFIFVVVCGERLLSALYADIYTKCRGVEEAGNKKHTTTPADSNAKSEKRAPFQQGMPRLQIRKMDPAEEKMEHVDDSLLVRAREERLIERSRLVLLHESARQQQDVEHAGYCRAPYQECLAPSRRLCANTPRVSLTCSESCAILYHAECWKIIHLRHSSSRLREIDRACPTPECQGSWVTIQEFDSSSPPSPKKDDPNIDQGSVPEIRIPPPVHETATPSARDFTTTSPTFSQNESDSYAEQDEKAIAQPRARAVVSLPCTTFERKNAAVRQVAATPPVLRQTTPTPQRKEQKSETDATSVKVRVPLQSRPTRWQDKSTELHRPTKSERKRTLIEEAKMAKKEAKRLARPADRVQQNAPRTAHTQSRSSADKIHDLSMPVLPLVSQSEGDSDAFKVSQGQVEGQVNLPDFAERKDKRRLRQANKKHAKRILSPKPLRLDISEFNERMHLLSD